VRDRRILTNPARGVNLPRKEGKARVYLSHVQVELLASKCGPRGTLVDFLAYTGLRWGEVTALRVGDLDTARRRVNVQRNAVMVGGDLVIGTPKSHESRSVPCPRFLEEPSAISAEARANRISCSATASPTSARPILATASGCEPLQRAVRSPGFSAHPHSA